MTFAEAVSYLTDQANELVDPGKTTLLTGLSEVDSENAQIVRDAGVVKINEVVELLNSDPCFDAADEIAETVNPNAPNYPTRPH